MEKIKANTTYYTRSIGDHNCIFELTVLSRTAKTALINYDNEKTPCKNLHRFRRPRIPPTGPLELRPNLPRRQHNKAKARLGITPKAGSNAS